MIGIFLLIGFVSKTLRRTLYIIVNYLFKSLKGIICSSLTILDFVWLIYGPFCCDDLGWPKYHYFLILYSIIILIIFIACLNFEIDVDNIEVNEIIHEKKTKDSTDQRELLEIKGLLQHCNTQIDKISKELQIYNLDGLWNAINNLKNQNSQTDLNPYNKLQELVYNNSEYLYKKTNKLEEIAESIKKHDEALSGYIHSFLNCYIPSLEEEAGEMKDLFLKSQAKSNYKDQLINNCSTQVEFLAQTISLAFNIPFHDADHLFEEYDKLLDNEKTYEFLMKPIFAIPEINKSQRILKCLREREILSIFHLCQCRRDDIESMEGMGNSFVRKMESILLSYGLSFNMNVNSVVESHDVFMDLKNGTYGHLLKNRKLIHVLGWSIHDMCLSDRLASILENNLNLKTVKDILYYPNFLREGLKNEGHCSNANANAFLYELNHFVETHGLSWNRDLKYILGIN